MLRMSPGRPVLQTPPRGNTSCPAPADQEVALSHTLWAPKGMARREIRVLSSECYFKRRGKLYAFEPVIWKKERILKIKRLKASVQSFEFCSRESLFHRFS